MSKKYKKRIGEKFIGIYSQMYKSNAFKNLSPNAVRILVELKWRYNGYNNGEISLSIREVASICKIGKSSAFKTILELLKSGFIKLNSLGMFTYKQASIYELTFEEYRGKTPTNDWRIWPENHSNKINAKNLFEYQQYLAEYCKLNKAM